MRSEISAAIEKDTQHIASAQSTLVAAAESLVLGVILSV